MLYIKATIKSREVYFLATRLLKHNIKTKRFIPRRIQIHVVCTACKRDRKPTITPTRTSPLYYGFRGRSLINQNQKVTSLNFTLCRFFPGLLFHLVCIPPIICGFFFLCKIKSHHGPTVPVILRKRVQRQ